MFVKRYGFLFYAKHVNKPIGKIISKSFSGKYSQNFLDFSKQSAAALECRRLLENLCIVIICYPVIICCFLLGNLIVVIICFPLDDIMNFKINVGFLIKAFSHVNENVNIKI